MTDDDLTALVRLEAYCSLALEQLSEFADRGGEEWAPSVKAVYDWASSLIRSEDASVEPDS